MFHLEDVTNWKSMICCAVLTRSDKLLDLWDLMIIA